MTREDLKKHCEVQIQHNERVEEHKLTLDLIDRLGELEKLAGNIKELATTRLAKLQTYSISDNPLIQASNLVLTTAYTELLTMLMEV